MHKAIWHNNALTTNMLSKLKKKYFWYRACFGYASNFGHFSCRFGHFLNYFGIFFKWNTFTLVHGLSIFLWFLTIEPIPITWNIWHICICFTMKFSSIDGSDNFTVVCPLTYNERYNDQWVLAVIHCIWDDTNLISMSRWKDSYTHMF